MDWSRKEIAQALEVSSTTVNEWVKERDFPAASKDPADGRRWVYTASAVIRWYVRREVAKVIGPANSLERAGDPQKVFNLQQERARLARVQAEQKELDLAEKRGEVVGTGAARQALAHAFGAARAILLSVHAKCAETYPELPIDVVEGIRQMHHDALTALSTSPMPGADTVEDELEEVES